MTADGEWEIVDLSMLSEEQLDGVWEMLKWIRDYDMDRARLED